MSNRKAPSRLLMYGLAGALVIVLTACKGGAHGGDDTPTNTPTSDSVTVSPSSAVPTTSAPVSATSTSSTPTDFADIGQGADAAPQAGSQTTATFAKFNATVAYETMDAADLNRANGPYKGRTLAQTYGLAICKVIGEGTNTPDGIVNKMATNAGFSKTGAAAIVAAALRDLCRDSDQGYRTGFDDQVATARTSIQRDTGALPTEVATGQAAKVVCDNLGQNNGSGQLDAYLRAHQVLPYGPNYGNLKVYKQTVGDLVQAHCSSYFTWLSGYWLSY